MTLSNNFQNCSNTPEACLEQRQALVCTTTSGTRKWPILKNLIQPFQNSIKPIATLVLLLLLSMTSYADHGEAIVSDIDYTGCGTYNGFYTHVPGSTGDHVWVVFDAEAGSTITIDVDTDITNGAVGWLYRSVDCNVEVGDAPDVENIHVADAGLNSSEDFILTYTVINSGQFAFQLDSWLGGSGNYSIELSGCASIEVCCDENPPTSTCGNLTLEVTDRCPGPLGANTPDPSNFINPNAAGILTLGFGGLPYEFDVNCVTDDASSIENIGFAIQTSVSTTNTNCLLVIEQTYDIQDECGNITEDAFTTTVSFVDQDPPEIICPPDAALDCGESLDPFENTCAEVYIDQSLTGPSDFSAAATYINFDDISTPGASVDVVGNEYIALGLTMSASGDLAISDDGAPCGTTPNSFPNALTNFNCTTNGFNPQDVQFNFGSLMNRVGFSTIGNGSNLTLEIQCSSNGVPIGNETVTINQTYQFIGIESAVGFDQIVVVTTGDMYLEIDDLYFEGCPDALPIPMVMDCNPDELTYSDGALTACGAGDYSFTRTWTATDECGLSSTCDQTITLTDNEAPVLECYIFNPQPDGADMANPVVVGTSQHWTTDNGGTLIPSNNIDVCDGEVTFNTPDVEDDCDTGATLRMRITQNVDTDPSISFDEDVSESEQRDEFFPKGLSYVEFFATDACGNTSEVGCDFYILVVDDIAPVVESLVPGDVTVECFDDPAVTSPPDLEFSDNCDANINDPNYEPIVISATSETTPGDCANNFVIVHTWTYTQMCDDDNDPNTEPLTTTVSQTVTVDDQTPPVLECPADVAIECDEDTSPANTGVATATDNCMDSDPTDSEDYPLVTWTDVSTQDMDGLPGTCDDYQYEITRTWTAIDECGNTSSCDQIITVDDTTAPEIECPADMEVACDESMDPTMISEGFTGDFDPANWTVNTNGGDGSVDVSGAPVSVSLESSDNGVVGNTELCIAAPADGTIAFAWSFTTSDIDGALFDPFGYSVNGSFVQLTDDNGGISQSGTVMVNLLAGDDFCFAQTTVDAGFGSATTISDMFIYESLGTGMATATDNCAMPAVSFSDAITPGACPEEYTITRTWTATDACGNASSCDQIIEVVDDEAPEITCPADAEVSCEDDSSSAATGVATAEDNCSTLEITESDASAQGEDPAACDFYTYDITRTWTATDACGNESSCDQIIAVSDETAPVWDVSFQLDVTLTTEIDDADCPADAEISLNVGDEITVFDTWLAGGISVPSLQGAVSDNCAAEDYLTIRVVDKTKDVAEDNCSSVLTITFEAEDPCGNVEGTFSCTYMFVDDTAPEITPGTEPQDQELTAAFTGCTQLAYIYLPLATDNCQFIDFTNVSISAAGVNFSPMTPGFNPNGGFGLYWTGMFSLGTTEVTITVDDGCGNETSITHEITVIDTEPPFIKTPCPDDILATTDGGDCDTTLTFTNPEYDDFCLCAGMEVCFTSDDIDPSLLPSNVSYTGTSGNLADITATFYKGTTTVTFKVSDPSGNVNDECSFDVVVEDNDAPTFADQIDHALTTSEGADCPGVATTDLVVGAFDFDDSFTVGGVVIAGPLSTDYADNCPEMYLEVLSIDDNEDGCDREWLIVWQVTDCGGNTATQDQLISLSDDVAPEWSDDLDEFFFTTSEGSECPSDVLVSISAGDVLLPLDTWTIGGNTIPALDDLAQDDCTDVTYNVVSVDITLDDCETVVVVVFSASDACENESGPDFTCIVTITDDVAPEIACPADVVVQCDESMDPEVMVEGFTGDFDPANWTVNTNGGDGSVDVSGAPVSVSLVSSDNGIVGATELCIAVPADGSIAFDWSYSTDDASPLWDAFGYSVNGSFVQLTDDNGSASQTGTAMVSLNAGDDFCFVQSTVDAIFGSATTISDMFVYESVGTGMATATDDCNAIDISYVDVITPGTCPQEYTITRTWTATDVCGNASSCDQTIEVVDTEAPVIDPEAEDLTVECDGLGNEADLAGWLASNGGASATDNCGEVTWSYAPNPAELSDLCGATGSVEVTFTASDECGNTSETTATFTIEDTQAPTGEDPTGVSDLVVCKDEASEALPLADDIAAIEDGYSDICGGISVSLDEEICEGDDCAWTLTRNFLVTDECGNPTPSTIVHTGGDTEAPEFTSTPEDQVVDIVGTDCSQVVYITVPDYIDNCTDMNLTHVSISADPFVNFAPIQQNAVTGGYFWTGTFEAGVTNVTITITDDCDNSTDDVHTVTIVDDIPPFLSLSQCPSDVELDTDDGTCQTSYAWQNPSYQDNCQCNRMEICFSSDDAAFVPSMITYQETSGNAAMVGPLDFAKGTTTVCYKVYDDSDNLNDECCFDVVVLDDELPTASPTIAGATYECAAEIPEPDVSLVTDVEDNCPDPVVTWGSDADNGGSGCNGDPLVVTRTYIVTDCGENTIEVTQEFVVEDLTAPTASDPAAITVDCEADVPEADPEVVLDEADNCGGEVTVSLASESSTGGTGCGDPLIITRDYLVEDCGGLSVTVSHVITVDDQTAPEAVCQDIEVVLDGEGVATIEASDIDNGSSDVCGDVSLSVDITEFTCADWGTPVMVTLTVEDENCNVSTCTAMVTVLDEEAPVAVCPASPIELFLDENGEATLAADAAGDGSSTDNCSVTETSPEVNVTCADISVDGATGVTVDITATDAYGLTSVVTCDVFVYDNLGPVATSCQSDIIDNALTGQCFNQFDWAYPVFVDNCDGTITPTDATTLTVTASDQNVNIQFESTGLEGDFPVGTTTVEMCTTDSNGNEGCCSFTVTVLDVDAPEASFELDVIDLEVCTDNQSVNGDSYAWDFGDGTTSEDEDLCHTYAEPGTYTVCLTVTSACGSEDEICEDVTVEPEMLVELTPSFLTDGSTFGEAQCRDAVYIIDNVDLESTNGIVQFLIAKPSAFTLTIDPNATTANVFGGLPADNTDWIITDLGSSFLLTMPMPDTIPGGGYTIIAMEICATGLPTSTGQTTGQLINFTGGDVELGNNFAQGTLIIN